MRIYKPTIRQRDGTYRETEKFYVEFRDHLGVVHRLAGFIEEDDTKELARNVKELVKLRTVGLEPTVKLQGWLETVPWTVIVRLTEWQIIDGERAEITKPLLLHIQEYAETLRDRRRSKDYCSRVPNRLRKIVKDCRFNFFRDITRTKVSSYLHRLQKNECSDTTVGHYADAIIGFLNWAVAGGRISKNCLEKLPKPNRDSEEKGVLTPKQFLHLIGTTFEKNEFIGSSTGTTRAILYLLAGVTGLRRRELLLLTWSNIHLLGDTAFVRVPKKLAKNSKTTDQPIADATMAILKAYQAEKKPKPNDRVFSSMSVYVNTADLIRHDLKAAKLPLTDRDGNEIVFHSLRNSYASFLANSSTPPKVTQKLMRHSDPKLTFSLYARSFEASELQAIKALPDVTDFAGQFCLARCLAPQDTQVRTSADNSAQKNAVSDLEQRFLHVTQYPQGESNPCLQDENLIS